MTQELNDFLGLRASDGVLSQTLKRARAGSPPGTNHPIAGVHAGFGQCYGNHARGHLRRHDVAFVSNGSWPRSKLNRRAATPLGQHSTCVAGQARLTKPGRRRDSLRVFSMTPEYRNYARTAQQIADGQNLEDYFATGLLGRWGLNEGAATVGNDSSGQ